MKNPDKIAFTLFGTPVYWYGVLISIGILLAVLFATSEAKRKRLHPDTILDLCLILIPCGIVGARVYYVLFELERYIQNPISMFYIWEGGLAIYGAIIGGGLGLFFYAKKKKIGFFKLADIIAPGLALAQGIGRWGNFFNQEAFGLPVTDPSLLFFPLAVRIDDVHYFDFGHGAGLELCTIPYHLATFFYESVWCILIFAFLWFFLRKRTKHNGDLLLTYAMLYGFERAIVEGLRGDSLWLIPDVVRVSQLLSFLLFAAVLIFFLIRRAREKKLGRLIWPSPEPALAEADIESADMPEADALQRDTAAHVDTNQATKESAEGVLPVDLDERASAHENNQEKTGE